METLFGIPINGLMTVLLVVFGLCVAVLVLSALNNKVMFRIAARNPLRRPGHTALTVLGLMIAAMIFSASFSTGDTLTNSIRSDAVKNLGQVDIEVMNEETDVSGGAGGPHMADGGGANLETSYFDQNQFDKVADSLSGLVEDGTVDGIAPAIVESVPVVTESRANEPAVDLLGLDYRYMDSFDPLTGNGGSELSLEELESRGEGYIYISSALAEALEIDVGERLDIYLTAEATPVTITGIYKKGGNPAGDLSMVMPLSHLQSLLADAGTIEGQQITAILITNQGDAIGGSDLTDTIMATLEPSLEESGLIAEPVKQDALDQANASGSQFTTIFLVLGSFSIIAGILLIFLIFVMLAAERKRELGILRAVGTQRGHILRMFTYEGILYSLLASAVGSALGLVVGWLMIRFVGSGLDDMSLAFSWTPSSLIISFTLGVLLTVAVVIFSAEQVSHMNIVRAIKDIPDPKRSSPPSAGGLVLRSLLPALGLLLLVVGIGSGRHLFYMLGASLFIIGLSVLARRLRVSDRISYTFAGVFLLVLWLVPTEWLPYGNRLGEGGPEMLILAGFTMVAAAVWVIMYNSDVLLAAIMAIFGRFAMLAPVLKTAVSYPMATRFRTGMAFAMFSLIIFTMVIIATMTSSVGDIFADTETMKGGFDLRGTVSSPIPDIDTALAEADDMDKEFDTVASVSSTTLKLQQAGGDQEARFFLVQGVDASFTEKVSYEFDKMAEGYPSSEEVWQALSSEEGLVVVSSSLVGGRRFGPQGGADESALLDPIPAETVPDNLYIEAMNLVSGEVQRLRVIGILKGDAYLLQGVVTSQDTLNAVSGQVVPATSYLFATTGDVTDLAHDLEKQFLEYGMDVAVLEEQIEGMFSMIQMMFSIFQGFLGLGLIAGIAALGVIATRSVVERRQQIGMLRAIGFQRRMVQFSFLLEFSFIALVGIAIGIALAIPLCYKLMETEGEVDLQITIPWASIAAITAGAYAASLLTTFLPARQAANLYPAEALRYE